MTLPGNEMIPVGDISWRMAAIYANWLHNDKSTARSAFLNGAYDVSTFGYINGDVATDQAAHHPSARYWIPALDEMIKASHRDPNKPNLDGTTGGYWLYSNGSTQPWVGAPPASMGGNGTANFGWDSDDFPGVNPYTVPLGSYATTNPLGTLRCLWCHIGVNRGSTHRNGGCEGSSSRRQFPGWHIRLCCPRRHLFSRI